jgi:hypothetical protein
MNANPDLGRESAFGYLAVEGGAGKAGTGQNGVRRARRKKKSILENLI